MNFIFTNNILRMSQRMSKILFPPQEEKIHIFKPPCNDLFIIVVNNLRPKSVILIFDQ